MLFSGTVMACTPISMGGFVRRSVHVSEANSVALVAAIAHHRVVVRDVVATVGELCIVVEVAKVSDRNRFDGLRLQQVSEFGPVQGAGRVVDERFDVIEVG